MDIDIVSVSPRYRYVCPLLILICIMYVISLRRFFPRGTRPTDQGPVQWRRLQPGHGSDGGVVSSRDWVLGLHGDYSVRVESRLWLNPSGDWVRAGSGSGSVSRDHISSASFHYWSSVQGIPNALQRHSGDGRT